MTDAAPNNEIEEIRWSHNVESMTAIVGQNLKGTQPQRKRGKPDYSRPEIRKTYAQVCVAIKPPGGDWPTHTVWCDKRGEWNIPAMTGVPYYVRFADGTEENFDQW